uniref:Uncharacterized protein n=1 Tax=Arundo donax TaxID=35708 RepID=A0A0A9EYH0_ARUDO
MAAAEPSWLELDPATSPLAAGIAGSGEGSAFLNTPVLKLLQGMQEESWKGLMSHMSDKHMVMY